MRDHRFKIGEVVILDKNVEGDITKTRRFVKGIAIVTRQHISKDFDLLYHVIFVENSKEYYVWESELSKTDNQTTFDLIGVEEEAIQKIKKGLIEKDSNKERDDILFKIWNALGKAVSNLKDSSDEMKKISLPDVTEVSNLVSKIKIIENKIEEQRITEHHKAFTKEYDSDSENYKIPDIISYTKPSLMPKKKKDKEEVRKTIKRYNEPIKEYNPCSCGR